MITVFHRFLIAAILAAQVDDVSVADGQSPAVNHITQDVPTRPGGMAATRCVVVELFVATDCPYSSKARRDLEQRPGLELRVHNVTESKDALRRFYALADQHRITPRLPLLHACHHVIVGYDKPATTGSQYDQLLTIEVFVREGCAHCAVAKTFLKQIAPRYPGLRLTLKDVVADSDNRLRFEKLCREYGIRLPGVPAFQIGREFVVGYTGDSTTGAKLLRLLDEITIPCAGKLPLRPGRPAAFEPKQSGSSSRNWQLGVSVGRVFGAEQTALPPPSSSAPPRPDDLDLSSQPPPRPEAARDQSSPAGPPPADQQISEVEVPVFGKLDVKQLGMPLFTIVLGLVDGFNPCAMWVLLFLLSILINLHDRRKILAVAGTFVVISGLVYFVFMAAWLNVFHLIGLRRWSEVALGMIAVIFGTVNIKDFFAFKQGLSLSIPESAKPGIYARVRAIVTAQHMAAAICGAIILAILVNFVELLCTAGLPALYTKILAMQQYPAWLELSYLGLYNLAYMLDDGVMVGIAVVTLGRYKLQEREGRWLKLVSGCTIFILGLVLLFAPQWL